MHKMLNPSLNQHSSLRTAHVCVSLCTVVHITAWSSSDNFPSYLSDNHHSSDDAYWMGGGQMTERLVGWDLTAFLT